MPDDAGFLDRDLLDDAAQIDTDYGAGAGATEFDVTDTGEDPAFTVTDDSSFDGISAQPVGLGFTSVEDATDDVDFTSVEDDDGGIPFTVVADDTAPVDDGQPDVPE